MILKICKDVLFMAYIKRFLENQILDFKGKYPVIMITGARQVGKTTILRHIADNTRKKINFVTLDDLNERTLAINDPKFFIETHKFPLIIDEFQYAPNLLSYIKIIVDELRYKHLNDEKINANGIFYLTGSQKFLSMKDIKESLAGRVLVIEMQNLSSREIEDKKNILFDIDNIDKYKNEKSKNSVEIYKKIFNGGYPELINNNLDKNLFFSSYIKTYIERDIRNLINVKNEIKFNQFLIELAARTGQELKYSSIANDIDVSIPTIKEWVSILENTGIIYLLKPYYENMIKRIVKSPKIYFLDTGLATYLTKYPNAEILMNSAYSGQILETYVVSEIIKSFLNNGIDINNLYFYRDNAGNEIDLIYEKNGILYPMEIKKSKEIKQDFIKHFKVLNGSKKKIGRGAVLNLSDKISFINKDNISFPIGLI